MQDDVYTGGFDALMDRRAQGRRRWAGGADCLPACDVDLDSLRAQIVAVPASLLTQYDPKDFRSKTAVYEAEFEGKSALLVLHAQLTTLLQHDGPPPQAGDLFHRLWAEQGAFLAEQLETRWQIGAASTFADHGRNAAQTALGMGLCVMFDMVRLHDTERRLTGRPLEVPFRKRARGRLQRLAFDMAPFSLRVGDADRAMLTRLWDLGERDAVMRPLAQAMLGKVMADRRSIFARLQALRHRRAQMDQRRAALAVLPREE